MRRALSLPAVAAGPLLAVGAGPTVAATDPLGDETRHLGRPLTADFGMAQCLRDVDQSKNMDEIEVAMGGRVLLTFVSLGREEAEAEASEPLSASSGKRRRGRRFARRRPLYASSRRQGGRPRRVGATSRRGRSDSGSPGSAAETAAAPPQIRTTSPGRFPDEPFFFPPLGFSTF